MGGLIGLGVLILGYGYAEAHKTPEKSYEELAQTKPEEVTVEEPEVKSGSNSGSVFDIFSGKDKEPEEVDRTTPIYTTPPSDEIISADPLSGSVQLGDYLFMRIYLSVATFSMIRSSSSAKSIGTK